MEGLVKEAREDMEKQFDSQRTFDLSMASHYLRIVHYALSGFRGYVEQARGLGLNDDADSFKDGIRDITDCISRMEGIIGELTKN
ncbi:MAG: DUF892 family protein [Candidatus Caenarcaniphilales bacterium]|nr:DUF892 family protein [Candidatus Caenarcaniphilales bacterium]